MLTIDKMGLKVLCVKETSQLQFFLITKIIAFVPQLQTSQLLKCTFHHKLQVIHIFLRFGGSLPSVNKLASSSGGQKISDKLHTVHVKVGKCTLLQLNIGES